MARLLFMQFTENLAKNTISAIHNEICKEMRLMMLEDYVKMHTSRFF